MIAWAAVLPYVVIFAIVVTGPPSWSAIGYVASVGLVIIGLLTQPNEWGEARRPRGLTRGALAAIVVVALVRGFTGNEGESLRLETSGYRTVFASRFVNRLVDESDVAVASTRLMVGAGMVRDDDDELPDAMRAGYARMRDAEGDAPSPMLATFLGMQKLAKHDVVIVQPRGRVPNREIDERRTAIVFLGDSNNFALPCWQAAQAVADLDVITACPSLRRDANWSSAEGEAIVRHTVDVLRQRGIARLILMGKSNGAIGASRLAPKMRGVFEGLVLVSGVAHDAGAPGVPTLVLHGSRDTLASATLARQYALRHRGTYFPLRAGHHAMLVRADEHDRALKAFMSERVARPVARASL